MALPKMPEREFQRLLATSRSLRKYHSFRNTSRPSKRSVKANGKGIGQVLKNSRLIPQVDMNRVFLRPEQKL